MLRTMAIVVAGFIFSMADVSGGGNAQNIKFNGIYCEAGGKTKSVTCIPLDGNGYSVSMSKQYFFLQKNKKNLIFGYNR